jgi:hypothetical protein
LLLGFFAASVQAPWPLDAGAVNPGAAQIPVNESAAQQAETAGFFQ